MQTFSPKERSVNFGKEEKDRFKNLIEKYHHILFNKKTDNSNNLQKKKAWSAIHAEFNALSNNPRTIKQLQAKFDNMKRNARKDASKQRQERFKTGGGPPPPPTDADTDWLRTVMPVSMDGLASIVDDDSELVESNIEMASEKPVVDQKEIETMKENCDSSNIQKEVFNTKSPACFLRTPMTRNLKVPKKCRLSNVPSLTSQISTERLELFKSCRKYEKEIFELRVQHLNEKRKNDEIIFKLQEKKLLLEISLLERNLQK
ncbi:myb/SANT-like DNA-binding domain-containing protein 3 isoform X2 [Pieris napi]|uniref:myb/SANT-like DNA-binding domain-containing protein 3 isoform X2 n=1 Tax=Pieris napi TaxID=78633 RepID=UPI001FBB1E4B|nr:myb/SANT-like DNA-binding domain-containing protein 3 isoform X2 [Pieris napi]